MKLKNKEGEFHELLCKNWRIVFRSLIVIFYFELVFFKDIPKLLMKLSKLSH